MNFTYLPPALGIVVMAAHWADHITIRVIFPDCNADSGKGWDTIERNLLIFFIKIGFGSNCRKTISLHF